MAFISIFVISGEIVISKYSIAGITIEYDGFVDKGIQTDMKPYIYTGDAPADVVIKGALCDKINHVQGQYDDSNGYRFWAIDDSGYTFYDFDKQTDTCFVQVKADKEWSRIEAEFYDIKKHLNAPDDYYAFNTLRDIFKYICLKNNGVVLHSSAISYDGMGIAFSAYSGVGKSTHTSMWQKMFPDQVEIINDDTPAIMLKDGQAVMYGTPFCGTSGINVNKSVPLKAVVFLQRGEENKIEEIPVTDAIRRFLEQIKRPPVGTLMEDIFDKIGQIIEKVPVYLLSCNISEEAVNIVKNKLDI